MDLLSRDPESFLPKVNASFPNPRPAAGAEQDLPRPAKPNLGALAFEHRYRVAHRYTGSIASAFDVNPLREIMALELVTIGLGLSYTVLFLCERLLVKIFELVWPPNTLL